MLPLGLTLFISLSLGFDDLADKNEISVVDGPCTQKLLEYKVDNILELWDVLCQPNGLFKSLQCEIFGDSCSCNDVLTGNVIFNSSQPLTEEFCLQLNRKMSSPSTTTKTPPPTTPVTTKTVPKITKTSTAIPVTSNTNKPTKLKTTINVPEITKTSTKITTTINPPEIPRASPAAVNTTAIGSFYERWVLDGDRGVKSILICGPLMVLLLGVLIWLCVFHKFHKSGSYTLDKYVRAQREERDLLFG